MKDILLLVLFGASLSLVYYVIIIFTVRFVGCSKERVSFLPRMDVVDRKLFRPLYEKITNVRFTQDEFEDLFVEELKTNPKLLGRIPVGKLDVHEFINWYESLNASKM